MTDRSERVREAHRGSRIAAPAAMSRLECLTRHGISFAQSMSGEYLVDDTFAFNAATGYWRDINDREKCGYTAIALIQEIKLRKNRNAAALAVTSGLADPATPAESSKTAGEARHAPDDTGNRENAEMASGVGEAAVGDRVGSKADSRDLLPAVAP